MNDCLLAKRRHIEESATEIEKAIAYIRDEETKQIVPEIDKFAKLLVKAEHVDKRIRVESLKNLLKQKV